MGFGGYISLLPDTHHKYPFQDYGQSGERHRQDWRYNQGYGRGYAGQHSI